MDGYSTYPFLVPTQSLYIWRAAVAALPQVLAQVAPDTYKYSHNKRATSCGYASIAPLYSIFLKTSLFQQMMPVFLD